MKTGQGLNTVDIKGKDYVMVNSRVQYFRRNFKDYTLQTVWIKIDDKIAICKAIVKDPNKRVYSTGTAFEIAGNSPVNRTSHIENAETSAIGRCLGFCDIGIDVSIASAEEVGNAIQGQKQPKTVGFSDNKDKPPQEEKELKIAGKVVSREKFIKSVYNAGEKFGVDVDEVVKKDFMNIAPEDMSISMLLDFAKKVKEKILEKKGDK